jgi:Fe2+ or Zn2+ uptake regulation protein
MPLANPAEEAIVTVLRAAAQPMTAREVQHEVAKTRAIELARTWDLLWALADRKLIQTQAGEGDGGRFGRRWFV